MNRNSSVKYQNPMSVTQRHQGKWIDSCCVSFGKECSDTVTERVSYGRYNDIKIELSSYFLPVFYAKETDASFMAMELC